MPGVLSLERKDLRGAVDEGRSPIIWIAALALSLATIAGVLVFLRGPTPGGPRPGAPGGSADEEWVERSGSTWRSSLDDSSSGATTAFGREVGGDVQRAREGELEAEVKSTILSCIEDIAELSGVSDANDFDTLDEFLKRAPLESGRTAPALLHFRNIHLTTLDGEELRLQILPPSGDAVGLDRMQVKLFSTDDEDLPVPLALPEWLKGLGWQDAVARFMNHGDVVLDEVSEAQRWGDEASASLLRRNGRVHQMAIFLPGRELACALRNGGSGAVCRCLK